MSALGPVGRLGRWSAAHRRAVLVGWAVVALALGVLAPRVETALSGAGWEDSGSESVAARAQAERGFAGASSSALMVAVHSDTLTTADPAFAAAIRRTERILAADPRVSSVQPPRPGATISTDGRTAIVMGGAAASPAAMVRAADDAEGRAARRGAARRADRPDRRVRHVVGLQRGQPRRDDAFRAPQLAGHPRDPASWRSARS